MDNGKYVLAGLASLCCTQQAYGYIMEEEIRETNPGLIILTVSLGLVALLVDWLSPNLFTPPSSKTEEPETAKVQLTRVTSVSGLNV